MSDHGQPAVSSSPAEQYFELWQQSVPPSLSAFLASVGELRPRDLSAVLRVDLRERWERGEQVRVESYFAQFSSLMDDSEAALDLIYAEFLLRRKLGDPPDRGEYERRFPQHAELLQAQIALHDAWEDPAQATVDWSGTTLWRARRDDSTTSPTKMPHREPLAQGTFGRYEIVRLLGRGGLGAVYLARDTILQRRVAIKLPRWTEELDPQTRERFYREARSAAQLSHPALCIVYDVGEHEGVPFLALQFISGETLANVLRQGGPLPPERAVEIACRVAEGVEVAHRAGILHRDLKPANVMFNERDEAVVTDFGLATLHNGDQPRDVTTMSFLGTPAYAPPEQLLGHNHLISPRSDIYSLGVVLFEMLTARQPFQGSMAAVMQGALTGPFPSPSEFRPGLPAALLEVCRKATAHDRLARYGTMAEMIAALRVAAEALNAPLPSPPTPPAIPKASSSRRRLIWLTLLVIAIVSILIIAWNFSGTPVAVAPLPTTTAVVDFSAGLEFNGVSDFVRIPNLTYDSQQPLTIEAWVTPHKPLGRGTLVSNQQRGGVSLHLHPNGHWVFAVSEVDGAPAGISDSATVPDALVHVAAIFRDQNGAILFLDGHKQSSGGWIEHAISSWSPMFIGSDATSTGQPEAGFYYGRIHALRISGRVLYQEDFTPPREMAAGADTIALYQFREGSGQRLVDASGHGHHGEIVGAKWIRSNESNAK